MEMTNSKLGSYIVGFATSIILTLLAYFLITQHVFDYRVGLWIVAGLAVIQLFVQLVFFLHLGKEAKPRWNLLMFGFGVMVVVIVVIGSLWIMGNLNYNMMNSPETENYMHDNEGL